MQDDTGHPRDGSHFAAWSWSITGIVLIYILSPPPLAWMFERFDLGIPTWPRYVYAPLILMYSHFEPVKQFYDGYSELLGVKL
ncbi:MAG TPA: hypothetical protein VLE43_03195 [Candidatus Saccharimonadia bacterium]|nr:hypothetical protein [Candidatus Saccharimonadia bacterium]